MVPLLSVEMGEEEDFWTAMNSGGFQPTVLAWTGILISLGWKSELFSQSISSGFPA